MDQRSTYKIVLKKFLFAYTEPGNFSEATNGIKLLHDMNEE